MRFRIKQNVFFIYLKCLKTNLVLLKNYFGVKKFQDYGGNL